jgi:hypothetical protein
MIRRLRVPAALLALTALSLTLAESAVASLCPPGAEMGHAMASEHHGAHPPAAMHHASEEPAVPAGGSHPATPECPLGMAGAGGPCVILLLPACAPVAEGLPAASGAVLPAAADSPVYLSVTSHFRPPRA